MNLSVQQAFQKGIEAHTAGRVHEAEKFYEAVLKARPQHSDANHNMGVLAVNFGNIERALPFFKAAIDAKPDIAEYWLSYIKALIKLNRGNDAKMILDKARSNGFEGNSFDKLEKQFQFLSNKKAYDTPTDQLKSLLELYNLQKFYEVFNEAHELAKQYSKNVTIWNLLGAAAAKTGRLDEAVTAFQQVLSLRPDYAEGYNNLGVVYKDQGKLDIALEAYTKALTLQPDYADAHNNMGNVLTQKNKLKEAVDAYELAIKYQPHFFQAYNNMGVALKNQGRFGEALEAYENALSIKPDYAEAYTNKGNLLKVQGKLNEAIIVYEDVINLNHNYSDAYINLGITFKELGQLDSAVEAYKKLILIQPDHADAYNKMGLIFKDQGKFSEALDAFNEALNINPDFIECVTNKAVLLFDKKEFEEAAKLFALDGSQRGQSRLLKCYYEMNVPEKFYNQLDHLRKLDVTNCIVGSFCSRAHHRYGVSAYNPFCADPIKYVVKSELGEKCDFESIFVHNAKSVLHNSQVKRKSQGHLMNGIQTAGNIFTQVGSVTGQWQDIIRAELTNYKNYFCESNEGLITDWPSNYSLYGWLVSMKNGGAISPHIHETGWISGSIYINVPSKSKSDSGNLVVTTRDDPLSERNVNDTKIIDVVTGSICLFPSSLLHYTIPFEAQEDRIVLAFDMIPA